ncbi:uncharacterized protein A1O5_01097 [Cladophialophora psammophila CBS 110553]|uniref:Alpha/beta hydrolase fold-3 domain-containing protein n=1 Tax=Cladophialophora psammophila CBS 110553 TaxID=1182543 RepID=W9Y291_9EURO|nr:uncharacterized protein A1O5_01097 [Cladophialophora psammophila CBS 110553]EXJ76589.1 hypothetical protein A1O5_01097 [Cladophialophora psammophila CBS 110553]
MAMLPNGVTNGAMGLSEVEEEVLLKQSLPLISDNMVECYDRNFLTEMVKMDIRWDKIPDESDIIAMREWSQVGYHEYNRVPQCKATRSSVPVETQSVPVQYGEDGKFNIRIYDPIDSQAKNLRPALVMFHGGGWVQGSPTSDEDLATFFASDLRTVVFGIDYRLAPEHNLRVIHEDCYQALNWVVTNCPRYRADSSRLGLWGCSAGGHLAATVAMRDAQEYKPSRIRQVNLTVPATCHFQAMTGPLLETFLLKHGQNNQQHFQQSMINILKHLYGKFTMKLAILRRTLTSSNLRSRSSPADCSE